MSELKRNTDFAVGVAAAKAMPTSAGIDESQPWRTADMQRAMASWTGLAEAGFDPYNHVGTLAKKSRVA
jgi:hypothetical protein